MPCLKPPECRSGHVREFEAGMCQKHPKAEYPKFPSYCKKICWNFYCFRFGYVVWCFGHRKMCEIIHGTILILSNVEYNLWNCMPPYSLSGCCIVHQFDGRISLMVSCFFVLWFTSIPFYLVAVVPFIDLILPSYPSFAVSLLRWWIFVNGCVISYWLWHPMNRLFIFTFGLVLVDIWSIVCVFPSELEIGW